MVPPFVGGTAYHNREKLKCNTKEHAEAFTTCQKPRLRPVHIRSSSVPTGGKDVLARFEQGGCVTIKKVRGLPSNDGGWHQPTCAVGSRLTSLQSQKTPPSEFWLMPWLSPPASRGR